MLPTFVIGLREGLEATLIVSIIATFLRTNGVGLRPLWVGLSLAVALALGVGVALDAVDQSLPQRGQEGLATVIAAVAVFFVTSMILWMRRHARSLKRDLELAADAAVSIGTATALGAMVFLSVLREGFETSVFLLSTFQASADPRVSAGGAVLGLLTAVAIGFGIYRGGVRLNLSRFFKVTGVFLVLVAAGLVLSVLRTAHATGWVNVGQGTTVDLSWLAPPGSVRTALVSGVLGMPPDPRQIELTAWACYLVPMLALTLWPATWKVSPRAQIRLRRAAAAGCVVTAGALLWAVPLTAPSVPTSGPLDGGGTAVVDVASGTGSLTTTTTDGAVRWRLVNPHQASVSGADTQWDVGASSVVLPDVVTVPDLLGYAGGRVPVGLDVRRTPGPFEAHWTQVVDGQVLTRDGGLVDAGADSRVVLRLTGGGLSSPRVVSVDGSSLGAAFAVAGDYGSRTSAAITAAGQSRSNRMFWKRWVPALLALAAVVLLARTRRTHPPRAPLQTGRWSLRSTTSTQS